MSGCSKCPPLKAVRRLLSLTAATWLQTQIKSSSIMGLSCPSWNIPVVKHGPILEVSLMVHEQDVSILWFSVTQKRSVHNFYVHLSFRQLPPADRHQQGGAEPAQHGQQHAATLRPSEEATGYKRWTKMFEKQNNCACSWSSTWQWRFIIRCCRKSFSDWLLSHTKPRPQTLHLFRTPLSVGLIFIVVQCFMNLTIMQADYPLITFHWKHFGVMGFFMLLQ